MILFNWDPITTSYFWEKVKKHNFKIVMVCSMCPTTNANSNIILIMNTKKKDICLFIIYIKSIFIRTDF